MTTATLPVSRSLLFVPVTAKRSSQNRGGLVT
jgi:hypothetical protein